MTEFTCPYCSNPDPIPPSEEKCPACTKPLDPPNVRAALAAQEVKALEARLAIAGKETKARNSFDVLTDFGEAVNHSEVAICRPLGHIQELVSNPGTVYTSYYRQVDQGSRLPEDNEFDAHRESVDAKIFPNYHRNITFGALTLDGRAALAYGANTLILKEESIAHRATVFEENTIVFARRHQLGVTDPVPPGNRATWNGRSKLAMAKLHAQLDPSIKPAEYPNILLRQAATTDGVDFVEVHIFKGFSRGAIARVTMAAPGNSPDKAIVKSIKRKLVAAGIPFTEV